MEGGGKAYVIACCKKNQLVVRSQQDIAECRSVEKVLWGTSQAPVLLGIAAAPRLLVGTAVQAVQLLGSVARQLVELEVCDCT